MIPISVATLESLGLGEFSRSLSDEVTGLEIDPDRRSAISRVVSLAEPGDVVVIAGKGHEQGQEIGAEKLPFDDREVAREALRA